MSEHNPEPYMHALFSHMSDNHGLTLLESELGEIRDVCRRLDIEDARNKEHADERIKSIAARAAHRISTLLADKCGGDESAPSFNSIVVDAINEALIGVDEERAQFNSEIATLQARAVRAENLITEHAHQRAQLIADLNADIDRLQKYFDVLVMIDNAFGCEHTRHSPDDAAQLLCHVNELIESEVSLKSTFALQAKRMQKAIDLWRAESPKERELIQPDLGALLDWLIAQRSASEASLSRALNSLDEINVLTQIYWIHTNAATPIDWRSIKAARDSVRLPDEPPASIVYCMLGVLCAMAIERGDQCVERARVAQFVDQPIDFCVCGHERDSHTGKACSGRDIVNQCACKCSGFALEKTGHSIDCDVNDINVEGIKKPCNCGAVTSLSATVKAYDLLKQWQALTPSQRNYSIEYLTGGLDMVAYGFTTPHQDCDHAKWAIEQLGGAVVEGKKRDPIEKGKFSDAITAHLLSSLKAVVTVADRKTDVFDAAKAAIENAERDTVRASIVADQIDRIIAALRFTAGVAERETMTSREAHQMLVVKELIATLPHHENCDSLDRNPDGILKPCNCGVIV